MKTKAVIAGAVLLAILLLVSIVLITTRPSPPPITVRHVKSVQSGHGVEMTFEITNHTTSSYYFISVSFEARNGSVWKTCFDSGIAGRNRLNWHFASSGAVRVLGPNGFEISTIDMTNLPTSCPLRLRLGVGKEEAGLRRFFSLLKLRFRNGLKNVPPNPFYKGARVFYYSESTQVVSDEFVVPELVPKANSEK